MNLLVDLTFCTITRPPCSLNQFACSNEKCKIIIFDILQESENIKRNELKLKLGVLSPETPSFKPKARISSAKQAKNSKVINTSEMDKCLVVHSKSSDASQV